MQKIIIVFSDKNNMHDFLEKHRESSWVSATTHNPTATLVIESKRDLSNSMTKIIYNYGGSFL